MGRRLACGPATMPWHRIAAQLLTTPMPWSAAAIERYNLPSGCTPRYVDDAKCVSLGEADLKSMPWPECVLQLLRMIGGKSASAPRSQPTARVPAVHTWSPAHQILLQTQWIHHVHPSANYREAGPPQQRLAAHGCRRIAKPSVLEGSSPPDQNCTFGGEQESLKQNTN
jgi:hypothetical protein